jgi:hypothetical protein
MCGALHACVVQGSARADEPGEAQPAQVEPGSQLEAPMPAALPPPERMEPQATVPAPKGLRQRRMEYVDGMPVPPGATLEEHSHRKLWIWGVCLFGATYGMTAMAAMEISDTSDPDLNAAARRLFVPIVGPLLFFPQEPSRFLRALLTATSLFQSGGVAMFVAGLLTKKRYLVYYVRGPVGRELAVSLAPSIGAMGATLTF